MKFIKDESEMHESEDLKNLNIWSYDKNYIRNRNILFYILFISGLIFINIYSNFKSDEILYQASIISSYFPNINTTFAGIILLIICWIILTVLHEFLHIIFIPHFYKNDKIYFCFRWRKFNPEIWNDNYQPMTKQRHVLQIIAPLLFLSIIPLIFMIITPYWNFILFIVCVLNISASSVDIYLSYILLINAPKNCTIINRYYILKFETISNEHHFRQ